MVICMTYAPSFSMTTLIGAVGHTADLHITAPTPSPNGLAKATAVKPPPKKYTAPISVLAVTLAVLVGLVGYSVMNVKYASTPEQPAQTGIQKLLMPMVNRTDSFSLYRHTIYMTFQPVSFNWSMDPFAGFLLNATNWSGQKFDIRLYEGRYEGSGGGKLLANATYIGQNPIVFASMTRTTNYKDGVWGNYTTYYWMAALMDDWYHGKWYPLNGLTLVLNDTQLEISNPSLWIVWFDLTAIPEFGPLVAVSLIAIVLAIRKNRKGPETSLWFSSGHSKLKYVRHDDLPNVPAPPKRTRLYRGGARILLDDEWTSKGPIRETVSPKQWSLRFDVEKGEVVLMTRSRWGKRRKYELDLSAYNNISGKSD